MNDLTKLADACAAAIEQPSGCYWTTELIITPEMRQSALERIARQKARKREIISVVWQYWRTVEARGSVKSLGVGEVDLGIIA